MPKAESGLFVFEIAFRLTDHNLPFGEDRG